MVLGHAGWSIPLCIRETLYGTHWNGWWERTWTRQDPELFSHTASFHCGALRSGKILHFKLDFPVTVNVYLSRGRMLWELIFRINKRLVLLGGICLDSLNVEAWIQYNHFQLMEGCLLWISLTVLAVQIILQEIIHCLTSSFLLQKYVRWLTVSQGFLPSLPNPRESSMKNELVSTVPSVPLNPFPKSGSLDSYTYWFRESVSKYLLDLYHVLCINPEDKKIEPGHWLKDEFRAHSRHSVKG